MTVTYNAPKMNYELPIPQQFRDAFGITTKEASIYFIQPEYHLTRTGNEQIVGYYAKNGSDYNIRKTATEAMFDFLRIASQSIEGIPVQHVEKSGLKLPECFSIEDGKDFPAYVCDTVERQEAIIKRDEEEKTLVAETFDTNFFACSFKKKDLVVYFNPETSERVEISMRDFRRNVFDLEEKFLRKIVWLSSLKHMPGAVPEQQQQPEVDILPGL